MRRSQGDLGIWGGLAMSKCCKRKKPKPKDDLNFEMLPIRSTDRCINCETRSELAKRIRYAVCGPCLWDTQTRDILLTIDEALARLHAKCGYDAQAELVKANEGQAPVAKEE